MDITEPTHYSIEEDKKKAEQDKMKKSAETLKSEMRQMIEGLRAEFRKLLAENDQLPVDLKMPREVNGTKRTLCFMLGVEFHPRSRHSGELPARTARQSRAGVEGIGVGIRAMQHRLAKTRSMVTQRDSFGSVDGRFSSTA